MRTHSGTRIRTWRRVVAAVSVASALVLSAAGCGDDAADQEITDVDDTQAPVDPTVEPVE
ncbi:hypothetical protein [Blastococcus saxobsidens]|uniref:hypothetical protein n=1 Tax=Blastococcus saxobsidens TaxID=138336 RepID=UPI00059F1595|nr:hypothetical protein [Blastococcus saxobsidens]